jgi:UDPglucose--hexose-1-phosphate uridylyltransferase
MLSLKEHPHRRHNPLTNEWVLVSPHRTQRPWQGQVEEVAPQHQPEYDPKCYLCPGNERAGGKRNPAYTCTFVFDNDFSALVPNTPSEEINEGDLLVAKAEPGICRVVCFSPRHDLTLASLGVEQLEKVIATWVEQFRQLGTMAEINHVQIFENRGAMMGASNPHPHCQIWAETTIPNEPAKELAAQTDYSDASSSCLLCDYLRLELTHRTRVVAENDSFVLVVPFWAIWPFETLLLPRKHCGEMEQLNAQERRGLAAMLSSIATRYDNLFGAPFPYSMGFHQRPTDQAKHPEWHMHAHFYPPLLRSASIRKFMVGYEMLGMPQRDVTPETAAERLRATSDSSLQKAG